ncbi:MAG: helix-turn-helix domain-containing protein [Alphaproteobacteria bacterium]|nr:helix-turn-helix domain-containing protein [Alphaproteobacteria bacterium]
MTSSPSAPLSFGGQLRHWRHLRGLSQLALALDAETTTRHLSYLENGRSRPGRDLVLRLAEALDLPLRARNDLLVAAGLAAEFPQRPLRSPALGPYRDAIQRILTAVHPFPAFVLDGLLRVHDANDVGRRLLPAPLDDGPVSLVDAWLTPGPGRDQLVNLPDVAWSLHARFLRTIAGQVAPPAEATDVAARFAAALRDVPRPLVDASDEPAVCPTFRIGDTVLRTIGMTMRFGPTRDITLEELGVDVLCPRDTATEAFFAALASAP